MNFDIISEVVYLVSGVVVSLLFLLVAYTLWKEKPEYVKSRIFLKYDNFKMAFYVAVVGVTIFLAGKLVELVQGSRLLWVHNVSEAVYNIGLMFFIGIFYIIIRKKNMGVE